VDPIVADDESAALVGRHRHGYASSLARTNVPPAATASSVLEYSPGVDQNWFCYWVGQDAVHSKTVDLAGDDENSKEADEKVVVNNDHLYVFGGWEPFLVLRPAM
jgi:hypothetical protein